MVSDAPALLSRRGLLRAATAGMALAVARLALPSETWASRLPDGRVSLYNLHTDERLSVTYRDEAGAYDQDALHALNHFLRCHHTNETTTMDVSGYRSPEYNEQLIRMGTRAARHSYHVSGQAVDVQIPGVPLRTLREVALRLGCGGVGYYPRGKFVHLDSGPFRHW